MDDRLSRIEERLRELDEAFGRLCARVAALERESSSSDVEPVKEAQAAPAALQVSRNREAHTLSALPILTLVGRTFVVLGGAYLLRALTGSGRLPPSGGILLGFAYASAWIGAADRAAIRRPVSGIFHGLAALMIGCPLLLEASTRFGVLSAGAAAAMLVALTSVAMAVAWHRRLQSLAGIAAIAGSVTTVILAFTTGHVWSFALAAIATGVMAEVISADRGWRWSVRAPAVAADFLVLDLIARARVPAAAEPAVVALMAALLLAGVYTVVLATAAISKRDEISVLDVAQSAVALLIGLVGAFGVAGLVGPHVAGLLGAGLLMLGVGAFALSLSRAAHWSARTSAVITSLATAVLLAGAVAQLSGSLRDLGFGIAAVILLWLGTRNDRAWLIGQGTIFAVGAAVSSGLMQFCAGAWLAAAPGFLVQPSALAVLAILCFGGVILLVMRTDHSRATMIASLVLTPFAACSLGALGIGLLDAIDGRQATAGVIAAERSVVAAVIAVALAALGGLRRGTHFKWLAYGALTLGGLKLALEDMRVSSPLAIFVALGAYGAALIISAKLLSDKRTQTGTAD